MLICGLARPSGPTLWPLNREALIDETEKLTKAGALAWRRGGFDLEGVLGALAALCMGALLGLVWSLLFWLGLAAAVVVLLATRRVDRTPSDAADLVLAPCDGVVAAVDHGATPPSELRIEGGAPVVRVRIASSPASPNPIWAPITGAVDAVIAEEGAPSTPIARRADADGLARRFLTFTGGGRTVGLGFAAGGLGPRFDLFVEPGDAVRAGRKIGVRRLGGWCDIYLPADAGDLPAPGRTLVGAETAVARLGAAPPAKSTDAPAAAAAAKPAKRRRKPSDETVEEAPGAETSANEEGPEKPDLERLAKAIEDGKDV